MDRPAFNHPRAAGGLAGSVSIAWNSGGEGAYKGTDTNHISNGLILRADVHVLFDLGLIAFETSELKLLVSGRLKNSCYSELDGRMLTIPAAAALQPSRVALDIHRLSVFN